MKKQKKEEKLNKEISETSDSKETIDKVPEVLAESKDNTEQLKSEEIQKIREKIEKTEIDDSLKIQANSQAQSIKNLDEEKKIKELLNIARAKGVIYAVHVAQKMEDPYILDLLHDILVKEGYYKEFLT